MNAAFDVTAVPAPALLWMAFLLIPFPLLLVVQARQLKNSAPPPRRSTYVSSILSLWVLALITIGIARKSGFSLAALGFAPVSPAAGLGWAVAVTIAAELMIIATFRAGARGTAALQELLPVTRADGALFTLVSLTAGITEEIIFRGFLVYAIALLTGSPLIAVLVSATAFGLVHAYQDPSGIVSAAVLGLLLTVPVLLTGSLYPSIVAHFVIDIIGGFWLGPRLLRRHLPAQTVA